MKKRFEYKKVDISTEKGIRKAERLKAVGWKPLLTGCNTITFEKDNKSS